MSQQSQDSQANPPPKAITPEQAEQIKDLKLQQSLKSLVHELFGYTLWQGWFPCFDPDGTLHKVPGSEYLETYIPDDCPCKFYRSPFDANKLRLKIYFNYSKRNFTVAMKARWPFGEGTHTRWINDLGEAALKQLFKTSTQDLYLQSYRGPRNNKQDKIKQI